MSETVIRVENLSKKYTLGKNGRDSGGLRHAIHDYATAPFRRLRSAFNAQQSIINGNGSLASAHSSLITYHSSLSNDHSSPESSSAAPASDIRHLTSAPSDFWALKDVTFDVKRGEVIGIIGRNGAGKSTLLKILSRITEPTTGRVGIKGRVASLLEVGTGFHPELTGRENIYLNGAILGMSRAEIKKKFDEIVAFAEVEQFLDTPVKRYSSGMYVRLAFAVAAHLEPEILVVDEVLSVGDAQFQKKCLGKMNDVAKQGRTVVFVSHDMTAIQILCDRAIHLKDGTVYGTGATSEQIEKYLNSSRLLEELTVDNPISLHQTLQLRQFGVTPNPIPGGSGADFVIELLSSKQSFISELAILIFDSLGKRVALLDMRQPSTPLKINDGESLVVRANIEALPLVEGDYHLGFYIDSDYVRGDFLDISVLVVIGSVKKLNAAPYNPYLRGIVDLKYSTSLRRQSPVNPK